MEGPGPGLEEGPWERGKVQREHSLDTISHPALQLCLAIRSEHKQMEILFSSVPQFLNGGLLDLLLFSFLSSLYSLDISPLSDVGLVKMLSQSVGCPSVLTTVSFALQKIVSFMRSHLLIVELRASAVAGLFRKLSPVPASSRLSPTFSSKRFSVSGFMLGSLVLCRVINADLCAFFYR